MNDKVLPYVYAGIALLVVFLAWKLFGDTKDERDAKQFADLWEFFDKDVLVTGVSDGLVTQQQVNDMTTSGAAARVAADVVAFHAALGTSWTRWGDDEAWATSTAMQRNYPEQLLWCNTFERFYGISSGLFLLEYMTANGWFDDSAYLARIVRHTINLRKG